LLIDGGDSVLQSDSDPVDRPVCPCSDDDSRRVINCPTTMLMIGISIS